MRWLPSASQSSALHPIGVFTIDFRERNSAGIWPPQPLVGSVLFSNFKTRACTRAEVTYLNQYISVNAAALPQLITALGPSEDPEKIKQSLLIAVRLGTLPHEERVSPEGDYAHPQIPVEN